VNNLVTYADVILPLALPRPFTYAIPVELVGFVQQGHRVIVPFKTNKLYTGIVAEIHHRNPEVKPRLIETVADEEPVVTATQLQLWKWIADYYLCNIGEVMNAALPSGLKLNSETKVYFNEYYEGDFAELSNDEFAIVQALRQKQEMTLPDVQDLLQKRNVYKLLQRLFNLGIALSKEELSQKFKPRFETYVKLHHRYRSQDELEKLFNELQRAPKQVEIILAYTQLSRQTTFIKKSDLLKLSNSDAAVLKRLVEKKIFVEIKSEISRLGILQNELVENHTLSEMQQNAFHSIQEHFKQKQTVLLHGVTGSGKTIVYTEAIQQTVAQGKQALFLLPEIALTAQLINRLRKFFGNQIGIYHSKFNLHERVEIWHKVLRGEYKVLLGARSALFLPFQHLGLVIIDEEHDNSYKQTDPPPRYQARDSAIMLAQMHGAKVILGSATPSVETMFNAKKGKFGLVEMKSRFGDASLPSFQLVNMKTARKQKEVKGNFSQTLLNEIVNQLNEKKQTILFLNRRGYAEFQQCSTCDYVYMCKNCDVSLTYHKYLHKLVCHYCGFQAKLDTQCKNCGSPTLEISGKGTEQIEEEIQEHFPAARVARLDLDALKSKNGFANVIAAFENNEIDILVGTQMVSKGLDFDRVGLVGIIDADRMIYQPGYRSAERAFQLITQVSGRAGRKDNSGKVIIQTSNPSHYIFDLIQKNDFNALFEAEIVTRQQFLYPPFTKLIQITIKGKELKMLEQASLWFANTLKKRIKAQVLGPSIPFISKINNNYLRELLIKPTAETGSLPIMKNNIKETAIELQQIKDFKRIEITIDVDV
jgi:primosomal protein N' (replication factor Y)